MLRIRHRATDLPSRRFCLVHAGALLATFATETAARETRALLKGLPWELLVAAGASLETHAATARLVSAASALARFWCAHERELAGNCLARHRTYRSLLEEFNAARASALGALGVAQPFAA